MALGKQAGGNSSHSLKRVVPLPPFSMETERAVLRQQIIDAQHAAIRELSTPLIPMTDTVVVMPLIGTIDTARARHVQETLLEGVARHQVSLAILDITGVQVIDTQVANALIEAAQAVKMLGAQVSPVFSRKLSRRWCI